MGKIFNADTGEYSNETIEQEAERLALFGDPTEVIPTISVAAQARLAIADDGVEVVNNGAGGIVGAFVLAPGLIYVQFTKDQGTSDYIVQSFGDGAFRCSVKQENQFSDGFLVETADFFNVPAFPSTVTVIVTRT